MRWGLGAMAAMVMVVVMVTETGNRLLFDNRRMLPAPIHWELPYDLHGKPQGIWGGDDFQLQHDAKLHYVLIEGVDSPKPGQNCYHDARDALIQLINHREIRVHVVRRDPQMREFGFVYLPITAMDPSDREQVSDRVDSKGELDVGYEILWQGWGWFDGSEIPQASRYEAAQRDAREHRRGLWHQKNPIPPWVFQKMKRSHK